MGRDAEIAGIPTDMEGAQMLLDPSPLDFEAWAVTSIPGLAPNERRVSDRGIDGRGAMMHQPDAESASAYPGTMTAPRVCASMDDRVVTIPKNSKSSSLPGWPE